MGQSGLKTSVKKQFSAGLWSAIRNLVTEVRLTPLRRRGRRKARAYSGRTQLKLNIGCGPNLKAGWVNIDMLPTVDLPLDMRDPIPLQDGCAALIYTEHFLEHLDYPSDARLPAALVGSLAPGQHAEGGHQGKRCGEPSHGRCSSGRALVAVARVLPTGIRRRPRVRCRDGGHRFRLVGYSGSGDLVAPRAAVGESEREHHQEEQSGDPAHDPPPSGDAAPTAVSELRSVRRLPMSSPLLRVSSRFPSGRP